MFQSLSHGVDAYGFMNVYFLKQMISFWLKMKKYLYFVYLKWLEKVPNLV